MFMFNHILTLISVLRRMMHLKIFSKVFNQIGFEKENPTSKSELFLFSLVFVPSSFNVRDAKKVVQQISLFTLNNIGKQKLRQRED